MSINEALDLLSRQIDLSNSSDLNTAYSQTEEALRTIKGLQQLLEDHKKQLEEDLLYNDKNEPYWQK